jgi:hypothetical protein
MCRKHQLQGQILTTAIWKPSLEYEHRMRTLCPEATYKYQSKLAGKTLANSLHHSRGNVFHVAHIRATTPAEYGK